MGPDPATMLPAAMCPFCKEHDGRPCTVSEKPNGRIVCSCGRHSWPNAGVFLDLPSAEPHDHGSGPYLDAELLRAPENHRMAAFAPLVGLR